MSTITLEPKVQNKLDQMVEFWHKSIEEILEEAINERMEELNNQKLDAEIAAFEQMHPELKERYLNQFVAIHEGQVVDVDADFESLALRTVECFGDIVVLIRQVGESPKEEYLFRSVRLLEAI